MPSSTSDPDKAQDGQKNVRKKLSWNGERLKPLVKPKSGLSDHVHVHHSAYMMSRFLKMPTNDDEATLDVSESLNSNDAVSLHSLSSKDFSLTDAFEGAMKAPSPTDLTYPMENLDKCTANDQGRFNFTIRKQSNAYDTASGPAVLESTSKMKVPPIRDPPSPRPKMTWVTALSKSPGNSPSCPRSSIIRTKVQELNSNIASSINIPAGDVIDQPTATGWRRMIPSIPIRSSSSPWHSVANSRQRSRQPRKLRAALVVASIMNFCLCRKTMASPTGNDELQVQEVEESPP